MLLISSGQTTTNKQREKTTETSLRFMNWKL